jgi:molybdopterin-containing oxidoreductase family iron-sulfur binding subunit
MPPLNRQWRSAAELARDPAWLARAAQEFPALRESLAAPHDRRRVLQLMAASLALAGLAGCNGEPEGTLVPPVTPAREAIARGNHLYATAHVLGGYATGILLRHDVNRPIKVEGNPDHPASLGATDAIAQAELLGFYDPDRAGTLTEGGVPRDWPALKTALAAQRAQLAQTHGEGLRVLTGTVTSPTLARQLAELQQRYPGMRWHRWEPVSRDAVRTGAQLAYGRPVEIVPKLDRAAAILAIDSDLLDGAPGHVRFARDFAGRRNPARTQQMSRVYAVEPTPMLIGVAADHRFVAGPRELHRFVQTLADVVLHGGHPPGDAPHWTGKLIADLQANKGRCFVHVGPQHPAETHALVHAVNEALGGRGRTYDLIDAVETAPTDQMQSLHDLVADMQADRVKSLIVLDSNPVFAAPGSLGFADALRRVGFSLASTVEPNETSHAAHWSVPMTHPFEDWSDARAFDGTVTIMQPQAEPLFAGTSPHRLLAMLQGPEEPSSLQVVQATWRTAFAKDFDQQWRAALAAGVVADSAAKASDAALRPEAASARPPAPPDHPVTVLFRPDPHVWDGRFTNNAWLQELPRPLTKLTWDNPLLVSPQQAARLKVKNGDRVVLSVGQQSVTLPAWIVPGQAADCAVALLGFGRQVVGSVGAGAGFNLYPLTGRSGAPSLRKGEGSEQLACTEHHDPMLARDEDFARHGTLTDFHKDPHFLADRHGTPSLYRWKPPGPAAWGMSVDLNACIGCNACVVACMAENNIPVVGKQEVIREREMHWLRIDRYYEGGADDPAVYLQPVLCQHCEQAPCELVCPVDATMHDREGLNVMVYNRCIGTRFCSNNCPYKVRRFNFFDFSGQEHRSPLARNPEVTVRGRGVMEKCTFCLQRIAAARIEADIANRPVGGNEVRTACQAACPAQAFSFGNMAQPDAAVLERKRSPLSYTLLAEQNTHPRVTYEARIVNPNPEIDEGRA